MRMPDENKKGICSPEETVQILRLRKGIIHSQDKLYRSALALIQQLQAEKAEQAERIQQLEAERDALMTFMQKECYYCKHNFSVHPDCPCLDCVGESHFEWRGVQKEESPC